MLHLADVFKRAIRRQGQLCIAEAGQVGIDPHLAVAAFLAAGIHALGKPDQEGLALEAIHHRVHGGGLVGLLFEFQFHGFTLGMFFGRVRSFDGPKDRTLLSKDRSSWPTYEGRVETMQIAKSDYFGLSHPQKLRNWWPFILHPFSTLSASSEFRLVHLKGPDPTAMDRFPRGVSAIA